MKAPYSIEDHGSIVLLRPNSKKLAKWLLDTAPDEAQFMGTALVIEPRYVENVCQAILDAGF